MVGVAKARHEFDATHGLLRGTLHNGLVVVKNYNAGVIGDELDLVGRDLLKDHEYLQFVALAQLRHRELPSAVGLAVADRRLYVVQSVVHLADSVAYRAIRSDDNVIALAGIQLRGLAVLLVVEGLAEDGVAVAPVAAGLLAVRIIQRSVRGELHVVLELHAHSDVAVGHDEPVGVDECIGAAVLIGEDDVTGGHAVGDAPDVDLKLHARAAALHLHPVENGGDIVEAVRAVGRVENDVMIHVELHFDCYGVIRHREGVGVLIDIHSHAAVAGFGDIGDVVIEGLG